MSNENKKIILVVDDAEANLQIIKNTLNDDSLGLRLAKSGSMGLMVLDRIVPDLILLDIEMPGMSGFDFMQAVRAKPQTKDVPVIFVTSHASKEFVIEAHEIGAKDYIVKPFDPELLRRKVRKALES